jgi:hypothetical protein
LRAGEGAHSHGWTLFEESGAPRRHSASAEDRAAM